MAIAVTSTKRTVFGNKKVVIIKGTFANGDTTGSVDTSIKDIDFVIAQYEASAKIINCSANGGIVTLTTEDPGATKVWSMVVIGH